MVWNRSYLDLDKSRSWLILIVHMEAVRQLFRKWRESKMQVDGCVFLNLFSMVLKYHLLCVTPDLAKNPFLYSDCQWKDLRRHSCISCFRWHPIQDKEAWVRICLFSYSCSSFIDATSLLTIYSSWTQDVEEGCRWRKMVREVCIQVLK